MKSTQKAEIDALHQQITTLEQQLADARDGGSSSQHSGSGNLPESDRLSVSEREAQLQAKLAEALHEKEKAQNARMHLEGVLEELQHEVEVLQQQQEQQQSASGDVLVLRTRIAELTERVQESETLRLDLERERQEKTQLSQALHAAKLEQEEALAKTEDVLSQLGEKEQQKVTKELIDTLEKENLLLKEEKLRLEEQITLLEKAASVASSERQTLQHRVTALKSQLHRYTGEADAESDDTVDEDFSSADSGSLYRSRNAALYVGQEEVEKEVALLRAQLSQQKEDMSGMEMEKSDWMMEREALEDVITDLRQQTQEQELEIESLKSGKKTSSISLHSESSIDGDASDKLKSLQEEVTSLSDEKRELENALEELDSQHSEALQQLIKQRDQMAAQLTQCNHQIQEQYEQIQELNNTIAKHKDLELAQESSKTEGEQIQRLEEKCKQLEAELVEARKVPKTSDNSSADKQIADLREKLQKGGLVINDLHMDKQELESELKAAKEEVAIKVAKIKELREENQSLGKEKRELEERVQETEDRLSEMEEEVEKWQQLNEERQVRKMSQGKVQEDFESLKSQLASMEREKELFRATYQDIISAQQDVSFSGGDEVFRKVLEEEKKVRGEMKKLKHQVEELSIKKESLTSKVQELQRSQENIRVQMTELESQLEETLSALELAKHEKDELTQNIVKEKERYQMLQVRLSEADNKLTEAGVQNEELSEMYSSLQREKMELENQLASQKSHYDAYIQELKAGQELGAESLQAEHQKLLDVQRDLNLEIDSLQGQVREKTELETALERKKQEVEDLQGNVVAFKQELGAVKAEISRLEGLCIKKDTEIEELKQRMSQFDTDLAEIEESVSIAEEKHSLELNDKEEELQQVKSRNVDLERSLSHIQAELEVEKSQERSVSRPSSDQLAMREEDVRELTQELDRLRSQVQEEQNLRETVTQLESELTLCNDTIAKLHQDLAAAQDTIRCQEAGIVDLNEKAEGQMNALQQAEHDVTRQKSTIAVLRQSSVDKEAILAELEDRMSFLQKILTSQQMEQLRNYSKNTAGLPALEYNEVKAIEFLPQSAATPTIVMEAEESQESESNAKADTEVNGYIIEEDFDSSTSDRDRFVALEKELDELRNHLKEKDIIVADLQKSNSSLLSLVEKGGAGVDRNVSSQLATHKLEAELRSLRAEREQMVAVVTEKSRENSSLKNEIHRLMEVVSAGQAALEKLQEDNRKLEQKQRQHSPPRDEGDEDMRKEALANMARLVRDRETEIEALKQKNETLLAVLQESGESQAAAHLGPLLKEKDSLSQQLALMMSEREQLIACVTQKHSESLAYHAEVQRLTALLAETQTARDKALKDYQSLIPGFEDKSQALVAAQNELVKCKQRLSDLEIRHGELIQRSSSLDSSPELSTREEELEHLRHVESDLRATISQRDEKVQSLTHQINVLEENLTAKENECSHFRKQAEHSKFQLTGLMAEMADMKAERVQIQEKTTAQDTEWASLRESHSRMSLAVKEKDMELSSLKEQVNTLSSLLRDKEGEHGQVAKLMKENESAQTSSRQLQHERDQQALLAEQRLQECSALRSEVAHLKDKEFKMTRELERLRGHLIEMEEGYTREALESEEREKELRNRLANAEEQLLSSSSQVEVANKESHRQIESLEQQLQHMASQRDAAYMQVANTQEQCQQYATSLSNLQLVLEHFQKEKDSAIAAETERLQNECKVLKIEAKELQAELEATRGDLTEALDGLEAASRLSEQLDRKEEELAALKEEVQLREKALSEAEEEIHKLNSSTEAKVDKMLMHNMVMTWLTSPENKRMEIVHLIGNILNFTKEDFEKIEVAQGRGSLLSGIFRRSSGASHSSTPGKQGLDQSFSQLFVKFLEKESSPPPSPVRLPAEAMAAETQHRHKPAFNPFTAPRHVTHDSPRSATPSHILMSHDNMASNPLFTPVTGMASSESAILKDVLGKR